jgi:hypothetical protein
MLLQLATVGPESVTATPFVPWVVAGVDTTSQGSVGGRAGVASARKTWVASELASDVIASDVMVSDVIHDVTLSPTPTVAVRSGKAAIHHGFSLAA